MDTAGFCSQSSYFSITFRVVRPLGMPLPHYYRDHRQKQQLLLLPTFLNHHNQ